MSQVATVTTLAIRELWISFRLLVLLVVCVGAGASVALVPGSIAATLERLALGLAIAVASASAVAGWSMAVERTAGRAGWLVGRSVGRRTLLGAWFVAIGAVMVVGVAVATALGWLTLTGFVTRPALEAIAALGLAIAAWGLAGVAIGLLAGAALPPPIAAGLAFGIVLLVGIAPWVAPGIDLGALLPGAAIGLLAEAAGLDPVVGPALRGAGMSLAVGALVLVLARLAFERADL